jgi:predicted extracellular nuclease
MAATDTAVAEFILSFRSTVATNDHLQVDDVIITAGAASIDTITIYDIQHTSDASGNSPYTEQLVRTTGVVTGFAAAGYFIQDSTGAWNGIYVYDSGNIVAIGDSISITGKVKEYYNFTELTSITGFVKHASGVALPVPSFIPVSSVKTEAFESVLVSIGNAKCTSVNAGYGMWAVAQGTDSCKVDTSLFKFTPTLNIKYDITAIVNYNFSEFRLSPRSANDIKIATGSDNRPNNQNVVMYPNPVKDMLNIYSENNIKTLEIYNMQGQLVLKEGFSSKQNHINISSLPCGIYCLKLRFENNTSTTSKLLKK